MHVRYDKKAASRLKCLALLVPGGLDGIFHRVPTADKPGMYGVEQLGASVSCRRLFEPIIFKGTPENADFLVRIASIWPNSSPQTCLEGKLIQLDVVRTSVKWGR